LSQVDTKLIISFAVLFQILPRSNLTQIHIRKQVQLLDKVTLCSSAQNLLIITWIRSSQC